MDGDKTILSEESGERDPDNKKLGVSVFFMSLVLFSTFFMLNSFSSSISLASLQNSTYDYYLNDTQNNLNEDDVLAVESQLAAESDVTGAQIKPYEFDAASAIVIKVTPSSQEIVFEKDKEKKLPIASLTKLMTALLVLEKYDLQAKTTVSQTAMNQVGEQGSLKLGESLSIENLLYISLIESSNRAAYALAEIMGIDDFVLLMNQRATELGLLNTHFADSSGLNQDSVSTVEDLAKLTGYLYENQPLFKEIISLKEYDLSLDNGVLHHKLISTNKLLGTIPGLVGGKTGFTNEARGCYMTINNVSDHGGYVINIILGSEDRLSAIKYVIDNFNL